MARGARRKCKACLNYFDQIRAAATASGTARRVAAKQPAKPTANNAGSSHRRIGTTFAARYTSLEFGSGGREKWPIGASPPSQALGATR